MLVASLHGVRIEAEAATRGEDYRCPNCNGELILKQGRKVIHHFAHKPPTDCTWASGETRAHRDAKKLVAEGLRRRGLTAEIEHVVATLTGDRHADVMAWSETGQSLAFELQHTSISLDEIEQRASSLMHARGSPSFGFHFCDRRFGRTASGMMRRPGSWNDILRAPLSDGCTGWVAKMECGCTPQRHSVSGWRAWKAIKSMLNHRAGIRKTAKSKAPAGIINGLNATGN